MSVLPRLRRVTLLTLTLLSSCAATQPGGGDSAHAETARLEVSGASGAYLSGRTAEAEGELGLAADLFLAGLKIDPSSPELLREAFITSLLSGRGEAVTLARRMQTNVAAQLLLANADAKDGRWSSAENRLSAIVRQGPVQVLQPLLVAWAQFGGGRVDAALATLTPLAEGQRFRGAYALHAALIADLAGRKPEAERFYRIAQTDSGGVNLEMARMLASWQARNGHVAEAQQTLNTLQDQAPDVAIAVPALYNASSKPMVRNALDGMAEAYLAFGAALRGQEGGADQAVVMLRLGLDLRPDLTVARLISSDILDAAHHEAGALAMLNPVAEDDPLIAVVRLRQAALSARVGQVDAALSLLDKVSAAYPTRPDPWSMRGDLLRDGKRFAEAVTAYSTAIQLRGKPDRSDWPLYYQRGIAYDRSGDWPHAEADLQHALQLSPDEPFVLNYLGYSWTEHGESLTKARQMIERAVALRPDDGAIVDSLGWVALRQNDTKGAVRLLQRAVELESGDSTVNMHLGDAYWAVGRKLEAQFQWRRALTLNPEPEDLPKLQAKLRESEAALGNLPAKP